MNGTLKKEIILVGPPASGKGTQTAFLSQKLNLPHIDTGALLRWNISEGTEYGKIAKGFIDEGRLVPTEVVGKIIEKRLCEEDAKNGFILDGYPRSLDQAVMLEEILAKLDKDEDVKFTVIYFDIETDLLKERIVNRRSCPKCKTIYNLKFKPPKKDGICDNDGEVLIQRKDDTEELVSKRLKTYNEETMPLIEHYESKGCLLKINANESIEKIREALDSLV